MKQKMEYKICSVNFEFGKGREQEGQRPAIIIKEISETSIVIVIPLTSNLNHVNDLPYTIQINKTSTTNLKNDSVALIFQLRAIDHQRITNTQIGRIEENQANKIKTILKNMLEL